jgi:hypothetical protein
MLDIVNDSFFILSPKKIFLEENFKISRNNIIHVETANVGPVGTTPTFLYLVGKMG